MTQDQFETLLARHGNEIFGFCCHITGNRNSAEDLYQDAVLKAFELLGRIDGSSQNSLKSARNYIIGIAVKLNCNLMRKKSLKDSFLVPDGESLLGNAMDGSDIVRDTERKNVYSKLREIIAGLPEKLRNVVYMYYYAEMPVADISQQLDIPQGTVKSRLNKARKEIKKKMEVFYNE